MRVNHCSLKKMLPKWGRGEFLKWRRGFVIDYKQEISQDCLFLRQQKQSNLRVTP